MSRSEVLVTGGAGFIGSHTVDLLVERGYQVRVLDDLQPRVHPKGFPSYLSHWKGEVKFLQGNVARPEDFAEALRGVQYVVHLAAYQDYMPDFSRFIHTNTESSALLFELIASDHKRYPVRKIVFASSQAVCGEGRYLCPACAGGVIPSIADQLNANDPAVEPLGRIPIDTRISDGHVPAPRSIEQLKRGDWEIHCPQCGAYMSPLLIDEATVSPGTAYGISKYAIELLADRLGKRCDVATVCMRYTYVQGPRNSFYNAYSGIARRFALRLLNGLPPVIYEDGLQLRDYINVSDVARANLLVMEDERANNRVFNVGGGRAVTVHEFAEIMLRVFGSEGEPEIPGEFRVGDTRHTVSDISPLCALGWRPAIPVEQSVAEYLDWMRDQTATREYLLEAERIMREQGVVRKAAV